LAAECLVPVHVLNQLLDLIWRMAGGVKSADQASHAGAGNQVDWHVVLIKPLQNSDVRQAKGTAPFQYQADLLPWRRASLLKRRILGWQGNRHKKQEEQRRCHQAPRRGAAFPMPVDA
jgi:hypothetical protein